MHDAQLLVPIGRYFVGGGIKVAMVDGVKRDEVGLELPADDTSERRVASKVQVSQPDQFWDPVS